MPILRALLAAVIVAAAVGGCSLLSGASAAPAGQAQREALMGSFIEAVQRNDAAAIAAMTDPLVDPGAEIAALLGAHGGRRWEDVRVTWGEDGIGGQAIDATITAMTPGGPDSITILVIWDGTTATLGLGSAPGIDPGSDPGSPRP